eukprot:COSAG03_NODE_10306_length_658_cov_2.101968_1_plen_163_part_01
MGHQVEGVLAACKSAHVAIHQTDGWIQTAAGRWLPKAFLTRQDDALDSHIRAQRLEQAIPVGTMPWRVLVQDEADTFDNILSVNIRVDAKSEYEHERERDLDMRRPSLPRDRERERRKEDARTVSLPLPLPLSLSLSGEYEHERERDLDMRRPSLPRDRERER